ncbi:MAG: ABC transporter permease [Xanthomonadaceae bacterium]|nr:ABC transporter permease [Xanthomonadaceae bacterium]
MKFLPLILAQLTRSKARTFLTLLSVIAAFMLFGMLDSVRVAFDSGGSLDGSNRLIVTSRVSLTQTLPLSLLPQLESVPGVKRVMYGMWFGGVYQDVKNFFPSLSVSPNYFDVYTGYDIPPEQLRQFRNSQDSAAVGEALAKKFGWEVGDVVPLQSSIFTQNGSNDWPLRITAIFRARDRKNVAAENQLVMHWKYFDEANDYIKNEIGYFAIQLEDAKQAAQVARAIDALSANSDHETRTETESSFQQGFAKQFADIGSVVTSIMGAVFFTLLLLTGNTMAQAIRERIPELAVLKTLGFKDGLVLTLVMVESVLLIFFGGMLGMIFAELSMPAISSISNGIIPLPSVNMKTWIMAICLMLAIGTVVGVLPALKAKRLNIVDALAGR